jgi:ubiquinone/menaquinone biosynthesis C-methylase UbiE
MELPFAGPEFSLVVTHDVLEHLDRPNAETALRECARVSRRQLHQVNTGRLDEWVYDHDESHVLKLSLPEWQEMAESLSVHETTTIREPNDGSPVPGPVSN